MRLFFYYVFHTVINTIKKIFKTWIAVFLGLIICASILGIFVGRVIPVVVNSIKGEEVMVESSEDGTEEDDEIDAFANKIPEFLESRNLTKFDMLDIGVTLVFFFVVTMCVATVNKGGQIFKPADVPILFASPMKPQSVLLFRTLNSLGVMIFVPFYMFGQVPNLVRNLNMSVWSAFMVIIGFMLTSMFATLLQITVYTLVCNTKKGSINIGGILLGFYAAIAVIFIVYTRITGTDIISGAFTFFGNKHLFWIPFWGWMRGIIYFSAVGETVKSLIYLGIFTVSCILMIVLIWNIKVDFYENAMFETEKVAEKQANIELAANGGTQRREKDRKGNIERDGFHYGKGAGVFFYKALYNRFRFAKFKLFTITFLIYLFAACIMGWIAKNIEGSIIDLLFIPAGVMAAVAFYRTLGNPLEEDTSREFFVLIPESPLKKIWASLLGSTAVCAVDLFIPMIIATIMVKSNPLTMLSWLVFILSVNVFGTTVGAFVSLSVPGDNAPTLKAMIQSMFVIFGIMPELGIIAVGLILKHVEIVLLAGSVFNIFIGSLFTIFTPKFLENR